MLLALDQQRPNVEIPSCRHKHLLYRSDSITPLSASQVEAMLFPGLSHPEVITETHAAMLPFSMAWVIIYKPYRVGKDEV